MISARSDSPRFRTARRPKQTCVRWWLKDAVNAATSPTTHRPADSGSLESTPISLRNRPIVFWHSTGYASRSRQPRASDSYLDEFTFRFNRRKSRSRGKLFYRLELPASRPSPSNRCPTSRWSEAPQHMLRTTTTCRGWISKYLSQVNTHALDRKRVKYDTNQCTVEAAGYPQRTSVFRLEYTIC